MAGLPHFTNSKASMGNYEPVFLNQFEILIIPPAGVDLGPTYNGESILTQAVKSIGGLSVDIQPQAPVEQHYKFATRRYGGGEPSTTDLDLRIDFEINLNDESSMAVYKVMRQWADLIYNPLTGAMGAKTDYVGSMVISVFSKPGEVFRRIRIPSCFISEDLSVMELSYESGDIFILEASWKADYWEDLFL